MKQTEIFVELRENKFTNWQDWNKEKCKDFVKSYFNCSDYTAKEVASEIVNW